MCNLESTLEWSGVWTFFINWFCRCWMWRAGWFQDMTCSIRCICSRSRRPVQFWPFRERFWSVLEGLDSFFRVGIASTLNWANGQFMCLFDIVVFSLQHRFGLWIPFPTAGAFMFSLDLLFGAFQSLVSCCSTVLSFINCWFLTSWGLQTIYTWYHRVIQWRPRLAFTRYQCVVGFIVGHKYVQITTMSSRTFY